MWCGRQACGTDPGWPGAIPRLGVETRQVTLGLLPSLSLTSSQRVVVVEIEGRTV